MKLKKRTEDKQFLFEAYFTDYQSPSSMYKNLSETKGRENEVRVDLIKEVLTKMKNKH